MITLIRQHRGRVVGSAGDSLLAEFASVVDAVQCAVVIQTTLKVENASLPPERKMEFRIGINLGDIVQRPTGDVLGDGVNIASRLQTLAEPDTICISQKVYEEVEKKIALGTVVSLGRPRLKNIAPRFRVYALLSEKPKGFRPHLRELRLKARRMGTAHLARAALVAGLLIGGGIVTLLPPSSIIRTPQSTIRNQEALPLPDKPSIAVLPFVNISEDPKQEYFSDGITEDLITDLSKLSGLFVISRNSVFTYKGKAVKVADVSKELGVRYVLEGSVRKADNHVRVTAQLVDASTDHHIWAARYDRPLQDIFALQDEIVRKIVTTLKLQLTLQEQGILVRKTTDNLEAYDYFLRGIVSYRQSTKEANAQARQMFERAVELDPQYAAAYAVLGWTYFVEWISQWNTDSQVLGRANELAQKAVALDDSLPGAHGILSQIYLLNKQHDRAIAEAERAIALDPNRADGYVDLAVILRFSGRAEEAVELMKKAMRLNPHYPPPYQYALGLTYCQVGRYEEAITAQKGALSRNPNFLPSHICLAACYSMAGRDEEARAHVKEVLRLSPNFSLETLGGQAPYKDPADGKPMGDALRRAGLK